jgi:hypothetical protein
MRMSEVRKYALSLPEVTEEPHFNYSSFRIRGKIFTTAPPEETHIHVFVDDSERDRMSTLYPEVYEKLWWGGSVVGLRVMLAKAKTADVNELLCKAWQRKAPKSLLKQLNTREGMKK